jgi:septal ring factor EnvC (AmiA/AmiB activator)
METLFFRSRWRRTIFLSLSLGALLSSVVLPYVAVAQDDAGDIQDDIQKYEKRLEAATKKKKTLEQNLNQVNASLGVAIAAVQKTQAAILDTKDSITRAALEIELTDQQITLKQAILADLVREAYLRGSESPASLVLGESTISELLDTSTQFATIGSRIGGILDDMGQLKADREVEKKALEAKKQETEAALAKKNAEKVALAQSKSEIAQDVAEQTATIEELRKKLAELESDLNTLTGKSYDAKDIK